MPSVAVFIFQKLSGHQDFALMSAAMHGIIASGLNQEKQENIKVFNEQRELKKVTMGKR